MTWRKRIFDLFFATLLVVILAPVFGAVVIWLLLKQGRPLFYVAERMKGVDRPFALWKFRTMTVVAADAGVSGGDKVGRITPAGAWLRSKRLDELPQLWNILKGDMSFVGPRPFTVGQEHLYLAAGGRAYFRVRPGITGPWQLKGRGATRFVDRVAFDEEYYREASLTQDLKMIVGTFGVVVKMTGH